MREQSPSIGNIARVGLALSAVVGLEVMASDPASAHDVDRASFVCATPESGTLTIDTTHFAPHETETAEVVKSFYGKELWEARVSGNGPHVFNNVSLPAGNLVARIAQNPVPFDAQKLKVSYAECPPAALPEGLNARTLGGIMLVGGGIGTMYWRRRSNRQPVKTEARVTN